MGLADLSIFRALGGYEEESRYIRDCFDKLQTLLNGNLDGANLADNSVTNADLRDSAALSVIGRAANTVGDPADIAAAADGQVLGRAASTLGFALPPGYEINYTQATTGVSVVGTTEAAPTDIISAGAITFDGTPVLIEFFSMTVIVGATAGSDVTFNLWDGATNLGFIGGASPANTLIPMHLVTRLTPSAGSHTYKIRAWRSVSNAFIDAGAGGSAGTSRPMFIRITKV